MDTKNRSWIYRPVDPVTRDNEYYSNWYEFQLVAPTDKRRIMSHRAVKNVKWKELDTAARQAVQK
jgi:hypothetical protein